MTNVFAAKRSPYVRNPARLADLIAAIQVMGTYRFASRRLEKWEKRLGRTPVSADSWLTIFTQHPEFFTIQEHNIALVWRRSKERNYDTFERKVLSKEDASKLAAAEPESDADRLSRPPLEISEISKLIDIAVNLHEREINHQQERRWWLAAVVTVVGVLASVVASMAK
jgi:hypothetical protein